MIINEFDRLLNDLFSNEYNQNWNTTKTTTYVPNKFAVDIKEDSASIALSVLGHDPKDIEINCLITIERKEESKPKKLTPKIG
jgi:hypothetical protein